ncbi:MAG: hypothetical protein ACXVDC_16690 [Bacteroidia bacterium]
MFLFVAAFSSCKKETSKLNNNIVATPAQIAVIADSLKGAWGYVFGQATFVNVSGIPGNNDFPLNSSIAFNSLQDLTGIDYDGNQLSSIPYTLTGVNNVFFVNIQKSSMETRKCQIIKLTADSLILQNKIVGQDTSSKIIFVQKFLRARASEISQKQFKITFNTTWGGDFSVKIYVTHLNGIATLVAEKNNVLQFNYLYIPAIGDHVSAIISSPGSGSLVTTLAFYKGLPFGNGWLSANISSGYSQQWDIEN